MILDILFFGSIIIMLGMMLVGVVKYIMISALITLFIMVFWLDKDNEFSYVKQHKKRSKFKKSKVVEFSKTVTCVHTKKDCEDCFSQSGCSLKEENVIENRQEV